MKKTWAIITISTIILIIAFLFFIFPGFYFTIESRLAESTPSMFSSSPPPSSSLGPTPSFSTGGPTPPPSGSYYPSFSTTQSGLAPSGSASSSENPSVSGSIPASESGSPGGGGFFEELYNKELREEEIENFSSRIASPIIGAAAIGAFILNPILSLLFNFPFRDIFYFMFSSFLEFLGIKKRRRPWGVVYEAVSKKPITGVVVKISDSQSGRVREMRITDDQGRFGFLVEKGTYDLSAAKNGFIFPSQKITLDNNKSDGFYPNVYLGDSIKVKEGFLGLNIPMDMLAEEPQKGRLLFLRMIRFFERIRMPILIFGTIFAVINLYLFKSVIDWIIVIIYVVLWLFELLQLRKVKPYGEIISKEKNPLDLAVIRFFKEENSRLVATTISDSNGRFYVLLPQGKFYLTVMKGGYLPFKSEGIKISRIGNPPEIKVILKKQS